jgi:hypothetical protein
MTSVSMCPSRLVGSRKVRATWRDCMRKAAVLSLGVLGMGMAGVAISTPAHAATILGGIDVQRQCQIQFWRPTDARLLDVHNAYSWRCYSSYTWNYYSVDMNGACVNQYGNGAYSIVLNTSDAYSWRCAR